MHFESLKVVSEHLVERIKLEEFTTGDAANLVVPSSSIELRSNFETMNNNLCSTMFLMNDGRPMPTNSNHLSQNNISGKKHENLFNLTYDKNPNFDAANSFFRSSMFATDKNFLSSRGHVQLTAQECGELFLKKITESNQIIGTEVNNIGLVALGHHQSTSTNMCNVNNIPNEHQLRPINDSKNLTTSRNMAGTSQTIRVQKERPFSCTECGKTFVLKHHLVTHNRSHSGERPHICTHCCKSFAHKHCLSTHLLLHSSDRPYHCQDCKKSFTLKHHLVTHSRVHSRSRPFVCQEQTCGRTFPQKRHLVTHAKFHSGERPFVCEVCEESFALKEHLVIHSRFHGGQHSYVCSYCESSFARKFELVNHERLHGRVPHKCNICSKEFLQRRTLVAHVRLHSEERQYSCQQCGEMFARKEDLTEHLAVHVRDNESKAFLERGFSAMPPPHFLCSQQPPRSQTTSAAVQTDTPPKAKPHVCNDCGKSFTQKHGLAQHNKRHLGGDGCEVRSHICPTCGKAFFQKNHLVLHSRQHIPVTVKKEDHEGSVANQTA